MSIFKNLFLLFCLNFLLGYPSYGQLIAFTKNPADAKIIYTDIINFIQALEQLNTESDTVEVLQREYFSKRTPGLRIFIEKYGLSAEKLKNSIKNYPEDYAAIPVKLEWLKTQEDSIRHYFKKFQHFVPHAVFPPTYYLVDIRRGIGSGSIEGQLITIEKEAYNVVDQGLKTHIIHELVHLNQLNAIGSLDKYLAIYNSEKSLLAITIREGIAEFFAELVTGKYTQDQAYFYTRAHERALWNKFRQEMNDQNVGDWMWSQPADPDQPRDTGYVLGAFIVEAYYKNALDISETVRRILAVTEYQTFLKDSGYTHKFK